MFTICMNMDKSLIITNSVTLYERETNTDVLRFLIPPQYTEGSQVFNIADYVVVCKVKTATGKVWVEKLECESVSYKDRLDYRMTLDSDFTQAAGMNTLYLTFLKAVTQEDGSVKESVFHSGSVSIEIQRKDEYVFIPDKSLQAIDQMLLALDERMNKLDSMVEDVSELRANDIEIIDGEIFAGYKDPETGEFTPMGDPISGVSHMWQEL